MMTNVVGTTRILHISSVDSKILFKMDVLEQGDKSSPITSLQLAIQAGEFEVMRSLFTSCIPHMLGWPSLMEMNNKREINFCGGSGGMQGGGQMGSFKNNGISNSESGIFKDVPF